MPATLLGALKRFKFNRAALRPFDASGKLMSVANIAVA